MGTGKLLGSSWNTLGTSCQVQYNTCSFELQNFLSICSKAYCMAHIIRGKKIVHLKFSFNWPPIFPSVRCGKWSLVPGTARRTEGKAIWGLEPAWESGLRSRGFPGSSPGKRRGRTGRFEKGRGPCLGETVGKSQEQSPPGLFPARLQPWQMRHLSSRPPAYGRRPPQAAPAVRRRESWGRGGRAVRREGTARRGRPLSSKP